MQDFSLAECLNNVKAALAEKRWAQAQALARDGLTQNPRVAQLWVWLGEAFERSGDYANAWNSYERGWILDPEAAWVEAVYARLRPYVNAEPVGWLRELLVVPGVTVAAALIVRDEERTIREAVSALIGAVDQIVVVDTGSSDRTKDIVSGLGFTVYDFRWTEDFSAARNYALSKVTCDWVLWIDADEILREEDEGVPRLVAGIFSKTPEPMILRIGQENTINDVPVINYDMSRMHPVGQGIRWWKRVHEQLGSEAGLYSHVYSRPAVRLRVRHDGYLPEIMASKQKLERNVRLLELETQSDPNDPASWGFLGRELYFLRRMEEAINALTEAERLGTTVATFGRMPEVRSYLVEAHLSIGNYDEALSVAERMVEAHADYPGSHFLLGKVRLTLALRLLEGASPSFQKALEAAKSYRGIVSFDPDIARFRAAAGIGDVMKLKGDWVAAIKWYEEALKNHPRDEMLAKQIEGLRIHAAQVAKQHSSN